MAKKPKAAVTEEQPTPDEMAPAPKPIKKSDPRYCPTCSANRTEQGITEKLERVEDEDGVWFCLRCKSKRLIPKEKAKK